jgi:hypothetical protein
MEMNGITDFTDDISLTHAEAFEHNAEHDARDSDADADSDTEAPPPVAPATPAAPPPTWTMPAHLNVQPDGQVVDVGSSTPVPIGKIYAPLADGSVRCVCWLEGHCSNSKSPCYIWLSKEARGNMVAAHGCIGQWLADGRAASMSDTRHRSLATTMKNAFREHAGHSAMCMNM